MGQQVLDGPRSHDIAGEHLGRGQRAHMRFKPPALDLDILEKLGPASVSAH
jgi:hypothetical protein